jgi:hypothetical protein
LRVASRLAARRQNRRLQSTLFTRASLTRIVPRVKPGASLFQSAAYGAPEALQAKGDKIAAVLVVNEVDGDRFGEIDQIGGAKVSRSAQA